MDTSYYHATREVATEEGLQCVCLPQHYCSQHLNIVWISRFILEFKMNEKVFLPSDSPTFEHVNSAETFLKVSSQKNSSGKNMDFKILHLLNSQTFTLFPQIIQIYHPYAVVPPSTVICYGNMQKPCDIVRNVYELHFYLCWSRILSFWYFAQEKNIHEVAVR